MEKNTIPWYLDAQLARVAHMMPLTDLTDYKKARQETEKFKTFVGKIAEDERISISEKIIGAPENNLELRIRIYKPEQSKDILPALIYMHGGGFVLGDLEMEHARCQKMAGDAECMVIAVDFRLAPEHPFPCGLEDCYQALCWVAENAETMQIDKDRIAVGGCSTGATLAAALALMVRDKNGPAISFQFLLYPALDDRFETPSMSAFKDIPGGDISGAKLMWDYYLTDTDRKSMSYLAAPGRANDLSGLPPTYLMTNDIDVCRDEAFDYAQRLLAVGVPTEFHCYAGAFHAFEFMVRTADLSVKALEQQMFVLRRALHSSGYVNIRGKTDV